MLKTRVLTLLTLTALACAPHAAGQARPEPAPAAWSRYMYPGEEFSVELPGMPQVFHTRRGIREAHFESQKVHVFGLNAGEVVYMIVAFDKPRSIESDEHLAGYVWGGRGLTPKGEVKVGGAAGREYDIALGIKGRARLFRMKEHAYLLQAFSDVEGQGEAVGRFLNSFVLGARPAGQLIADDPPATPLEEPTKERRIPGFVGVGPKRGGDTEGSSALGVGGSTFGAAALGDGPYKASEVGRKALIAFKPDPGHSVDVRRQEPGGLVRLRAVLSSSGKVTDISVVNPLPEGLTERAVKAARHILFFPAVKDGRRVSQYAELEYNFNMY